MQKDKPKQKNNIGSGETTFKLVFPEKYLNNFIYFNEDWNEKK